MFTEIVENLVEITSPQAGGPRHTALTSGLHHRGARTRGRPSGAQVRRETPHYTGVLRVLARAVPITTERLPLLGCQETSGIPGDWIRKPAEALKGHGRTPEFRQHSGI